MNILLSCAGGMSSSILAQALEDEAKKNGEEIYIEATFIEKIMEKMDQREWDVLLLAPQVNFRRPVLEKQLDGCIPIISVEGIMYTPMGAPALYKKIKDTVKK